MPRSAHQNSRSLLQDSRHHLESTYSESRISRSTPVALEPVQSTHLDTLPQDTSGPAPSGPVDRALAFNIVAMLSRMQPMPSDSDSIYSVPTVSWLTEDSWLTTRVSAFGRFLAYGELELVRIHRNSLQGFE